jgi:phosphatidylglycerophosphate synthase
VGKLDFYLWTTMLLLVDLLDGGVALLLGEENYSRRLLDTIRDKLIFFSTLILLFHHDYIPAYVFWWVIAYFSILIVGGYLSHLYVNYLPASDHLGRISLIALLVLIGYYYTTSSNNASRLFEFDEQLNTMLVLITLVLNISCIINYSFKILAEKKQPSY